MNNPLQPLLDESEKTITLQKELINNQKLQISNLTEANQLLEKENRGHSLVTPVTKDLIWNLRVLSSRFLRILLYSVYSSTGKSAASI